jgi:hypothetical protein
MGGYEKHPVRLEGADGVSCWREELASDCEPDQLQ